MRGSAVSKVSLLAGLGCCTAVVIGLGVNSASGAPAPKTLAQAMNEPHGHAAGDPDYAGKGRKGVDPEAEGVDAGTRKQAAGVKLEHGRPVTPDQILSAGDRSGACTIGYGRGQQCLPTTPPSAGQMGMSVRQMPWTCAEVRTLLPAGLPLNARGEDPAHLDGNGDGIACGSGDT
jgi:hypothetical protein